MQSAGMTDIEKEFQELVARIAAEEPMDVLYLEDDIGSAQKVVDLYEDLPIRFRLARTPGEAERMLSEHQPDFVVTDIRLGEGVKTGAEWLEEHLQGLGGTEVVVLTGYVGDLKNPSSLREAGIRIISKGDVEEEELWNRMHRLPFQRAAERVRARIANIASADGNGEDSANSEEEEAMARRLRKRLAKVFDRWVSKFGAPAKEKIFIGGKMYTLEDLQGEVRRGSQVGEYFLDLFVEDIEDIMGLNDGGEVV